MRPRDCVVGHQCNYWQKSYSNLCISLRNISERPTQTEPSDKIGTIYKSAFDISFVFRQVFITYQDGRVIKALDLSSNGRVFRVGSNSTSGNNLPFNSRDKFLKLSFLVTNLRRSRNTKFITKFISNLLSAAEKISTALTVI